MDTIRQSADTLEFTSRLSPLARLAFLMAGLFPLLAPYELLIRPGWSGISLVMLFFLAISIGAVSVSLFFLAAALWGRSQSFRFDASTRQVVYGYQDAIVRFRQERYPFDQIEAMRLKTSEWESRSDTYDIGIKIKDKREYTFGNFDSQQDAEHYLSLLAKMVSEE
jgi:hypothetical protein